MVVLGYLFIIPALLFTVENWRIWYWNRYKRPEQEAPMRYYPVVGGLFLFLVFTKFIPMEYGLLSYTALLLDYGCFPLACVSLRRYLRRK